MLLLFNSFRIQSSPEKQVCYAHENFCKLFLEIGSPYYHQYNEGAEAAVQTAKSLLNKNVDIHLSLLSYRSTLFENGFTPSELMLGRKIKSHLPVMPSMLDFPEQSIKKKVMFKEEEIKQKQVECYNKRHRTNELLV